ncbi:hypothetical protein [Actinacidiphila sp. bgisy167]|uniref:hypothetical protein n=1 Tax=Actinacidiphila sp. bgisy167 TaxID=3413797 RepID=UPI003D7333A8
MSDEPAGSALGPYGEGAVLDDPAEPPQARHGCGGDGTRPGQWSAALAPRRRHPHRVLAADHDRRRGEALRPAFGRLLG